MIYSNVHQLINHLNKHPLPPCARYLVFIVKEEEEAEFTKSLQIPKIYSRTFIDFKYKHLYCILPNIPGIPFNQQYFSYTWNKIIALIPISLFIKKHYHLHFLFNVLNPCLPALLLKTVNMLAFTTGFSKSYKLYLLLVLIVIYMKEKNMDDNVISFEHQSIKTLYNIEQIIGFHHNDMWLFFASNCSTPFLYSLYSYMIAFRLMHSSYVKTTIKEYFKEVFLQFTKQRTLNVKIENTVLGKNPSSSSVYFSTLADIVVFLHQLINKTSIILPINSYLYNLACDKLFESNIECLFKRVQHICSNHQQHEGIISNISLTVEQKTHYLDLLKILNDYQQSAINRATYKKYFGYFLEMGMGKTLLAITDMVRYYSSVDCIMLICKKSLFCIWENELKNHNLEFLKNKLIFQSIDESSTQPVNFLNQTIEKYANSNILFVLDESTTIKNNTSQRGAIIHLLLYYFISRPNHLSMIRLLSGTPISNKPTDFLTQVKILAPFDKIRSLDMNEMSVQDIKGKVGNNICILFKSDYPQHFKVTTVINKTPIPFSKKANNDMLTYFISSIQNTIEKQQKSAGYNSVALRKLRLDKISTLHQLSSGISPYGPIAFTIMKLKPEYKRILNLKVFDIERIINVFKHFYSTDSKIIFISYYVSIVDLLVKYCEMKNIAAACIQGSIKISNRAKVIDQFNNNDDIRCLICTAQCISHGFNLSASNVIVFMEPIKDLETWKQTIARIDRLNNKHDSIVINIVYNGSYQLELIDKIEKNTAQERSLMRQLKV